MTDFKPGDVVAWGASAPVRGVVTTKGTVRWADDSDSPLGPLLRARRLVVIDPEDREQVERLINLWHAEQSHAGKAAHQRMGDALREFATPKPVEPTDPTARISDFRDNVWRLLADGKWICVDGPDIGEYIAWSQLTKRGPLAIEVTP